MKNLITFMLILCSMTLSFAQNSAQVSQTRNDLSDIINYDNMIKLNEMKFQNIVTRNNSISLDLDSLYFTSNKDGDYYISLRVKLYSWQDGLQAKPIPKKEFGYIFKQTIKTKNGVGYLSNLIIAANQSLSNINFGEIEVKIVKEESNSNVADIITANLKTLITDATALDIIGRLLDKQTIPDEQLVFKSNFEIPLNSIEYQIRFKNNPNAVLVNNEPMGISLDGNSQCELLRGSLIGNVISNLSKVFKAVVGTPEATARFNHKGIIILSFKTDRNSLLPDEVKRNLALLNQAIGAKRFTEAYTTINYLQDYVVRYTTASSDDENSRIYGNVLQYLRLADLYIDYLDPTKKPSKNNDNLDEFHQKYFDIFSELYALQMNIGFYPFLVAGIYDKANTTVFMPYALDEVSLKYCLLWQTNLHLFLKKKDKKYWLINM